MTYFMAGTQLAGVERLMREGSECCPEKRLKDQAVADFFLTRNHRSIANTYGGAAGAFNETDSRYGF